jgi:hypothetical protein
MWPKNFRFLGTFIVKKLDKFVQFDSTGHKRLFWALSCVSNSARVLGGILTMRTYVDIYIV